MKSNKTVPAIVIAVGAQSDFRTLAAEFTLTAKLTQRLPANHDKHDRVSALQARRFV
jgi:hypothetical protein